MRLLRDEEITTEEGPVRLTMSPVTTSIQGRLMELAMGEASIKKNIDRTKYALKEVVKTIEIEGKEYAPQTIADMIDLSDPTSRDIFLLIGSMVTAQAFMGADTEKKSEQPPRHGSQVGIAENAPAPSKGKNRKAAA